MIDNSKIFSITQYVIANKKQKQKQDVFDIFNNWVVKNNIDDVNYKESIWFIEYIKMILPLNEVLVKNALLIDKGI